MNNIFSFQIPARPGLSGEVALVIEEWVNKSDFYSFEDLNLKDVRSRMTYGCREAELEYIKAADEDRICIGARLSRPDISNVEWLADLTYESGPEGSFFYVQLSRGVIRRGEFANMSILPQMPDVVRLIAKRDMLLDDAGFPITDRPTALSPSVLELCRDAFERRSMPILPLILANCVRTPELAGIMESAARAFAGMAHIVTASSEEELSRWRELDRLDPDFSGAVICFPRIGMVKKVAFQEDFKDILTGMTAYISQQNLPVGALTWEKLKSLPSRDAGPEDALASGGYYLMNPQMAEAMKTARKKLGFSQIELAARAGTTGLIISRLETLRITRVKKRLLQQIERALNLGPGTISSLENDKRSGAAAPGESPERRGGGPGRPAQNAFCRRCGAKLFSDSLFCHQCGSRLPDVRP